MRTCNADNQKKVGKSLNNFKVDDRALPLW